MSSFNIDTGGTDSPYKPGPNDPASGLHGIAETDDVVITDLEAAEAGVIDLANRVGAKAWSASTAVKKLQLVQGSNGALVQCKTAGTTGTSQPSWPTTLGATVTDGTVTWVLLVAPTGAYVTRAAGASGVPAAPLPAFNVADFASNGVGITVDISAAVQAAVNAIRAAALPASKLVMAPGIISTSIDCTGITSNIQSEVPTEGLGAGSIVVEGTGRGPTRVLANLSAAYPVFDFTGSPAPVVRDLSVTGMSSGEQTAAFLFARDSTNDLGDHPTLENVQIDGTYAQASVGAICDLPRFVNSTLTGGPVGLMWSNTDLLGIGSAYKTFGSVSCTIAHLVDSILGFTTRCGFLGGNFGALILSGDNYCNNAPPAINVTGCTYSGTTVTLTLASTTGLITGRNVTVANVGGVTNVNGIWPIASISGNQITVTVTSSPSGTYTSGGTVTQDGFLFELVSGGNKSLNGHIRMESNGATGNTSLVRVASGQSTKVGNLTGNWYLNNSGCVVYMDDTTATIWSYSIKGIVTASGTGAATFFSNPNGGFYNCELWNTQNPIPVGDASHNTPYGNIVYQGNNSQPWTFASASSGNIQISTAGTTIGGMVVSDPLGLGFATTVYPLNIGATNTVGTANQGFFVKAIGSGFSTSQIRVLVGTSSGNVDVGVYNSSGTGASHAPSTRRTSNGGVACPAAGIAAISLGTTVTINNGDFLALAADNTTATFGSTATLQTGAAPGVLWSAGSYYPLPAGPVSTSAATNRGFALMAP